METKFDVTFLINTKTGEKKQYAEAEYTKIDGVYGYLCIDGDNVKFFYSDHRGIVMDVLDNYKISREAIAVTIK